MRANVSRYHFSTPADLSTTLGYLADPSQKAVPLAGGTDLMVLFEAGKLDPQAHYLSIAHLPELRGVIATESELRIGALTSFGEIRRDKRIQQEFPLLVRAARETGSIAIQNRGTIGGNIANASPAADTPPALLVYEAEIELISGKGIRRLAYTDFHTGYKTTRRERGELIAAVILKRGELVSSSYYRKVGTRKAQAISKVVAAGIAQCTSDGAIENVRFALGSVAPTAVRCAAVEQLLKGQRLTSTLIDDAVAALASSVSPIDDIRSTAIYRAQVAGNLLRDFLAQLTG